MIPDPRRRTTGGLLLALALAGCGAADARPPAAPPPSPPLATATAPATAAKDPPPVAQVFAPANPGYAFQDPKRLEKLRATFPRIDAIPSPSSPSRASG